MRSKVVGVELVNPEKGQGPCVRGRMVYRRRVWKGRRTLRKSIGRIKFNRLRRNGKFRVSPLGHGVFVQPTGRHT